MSELASKLKHVGSGVLGSSWEPFLGKELQKPYMQSLKYFLQERQLQKKRIYPRPVHFFNAFALTPFESVKCVILGQDPYHQASQAHGLSFSVPLGVRIPPSLQNIFKELSDDIGVPVPQHGCLEKWAKQGVLMLNSVLSVEDSSPGAHQNKGWEQFTDCAVSCLSAKRKGVVFILWGGYARRKKSLIDLSCHHVIESAHPSPLSAYRGFFKSKPFSRVNAYLKDPIDW